MSAFEAQSPVYAIRCDHKGVHGNEDCDATFVPDSDFARRDPQAVRNAAGKAGWDVPPPRGKGSRSPSDFCPEHARRAPTP